MNEELITFVICVLVIIGEIQDSECVTKFIYK